MVTKMNDLSISGTSLTLRESESDIRLNFNDLNKIIAASNDIGPQLIQTYYSSDGGSTWNSATPSPLAFPGDISQGDPAVDWTSDGTAWVLMLGIDASNNRRLRCYTSTDGATWTPDPTSPSDPQTRVDRPMMWIDHSQSLNFKDNIYVIWTETNSGTVFVNCRTSGGWQTLQQVSSNETTGFGYFSDIKTNSNGDVFAFWFDSQAQGSHNIYVAKSTNGGKSFNALGAPKSITPNSTFSSFTMGIPSCATRLPGICCRGGAYKTATKDMVYAIWADWNGDPTCNQPGGDPISNPTSTCQARIWFTRSTNGGQAWDPPKMINLRAISPVSDQFNPCLAVDETNGQLVVIYYDTFNDPSRLKTDVWMQVSNDDGQSWSAPMQVTTAPTDETVPGADPNNQYGDYTGLSGYAGVFFPSWTDRRSSGSGLEEIWTAPILTNTKCTIITDRSTFGKDEIDGQKPSLSAPVVYDAAFYVVVDGFRPVDLAITPADFSGIPSVQPFVPIPSTLSQMSWSCTGLFGDDPSHLYNPQRLTWIFQIEFTGDNDFPLQPAGTINQVVLSATDPSGNVSSDPAIIQLIAEANPFETDGPVWYLSKDLLVFQTIPNGPLPSGIQQLTLTGNTADDCKLFIKSVIAACNTAPALFDLMQQQLPPDLSLSSHDNNNKLAFNFAFARVRCINPNPVDGVRVFFRLIPALTTSTVYDQNTTDTLAVYHRSGGPLPPNSDGQPIPLLGIDQNGEIISIPFFAEPRIDSTQHSMTEQTDPTNVQTIIASPTDPTTTFIVGKFQNLDKTFIYLIIFSNFELDSRQIQ